MNIKSRSKDNKTKKFKVRQVKGWWDIAGVFRFLKTSANPQKQFLVHMQLENGLHTSFIVLISDNSFTYQKKKYIIEDEFKYYDLNNQLWCSNYHEGLSIPIKNDINVSAIKRNIMGNGVMDIEQSINPKTLQQFIESQVIEKVMRGQELDSLFRFLKIMVIIILLIGVIHFGLFLEASGMLQQMNLF